MFILSVFTFIHYPYSYKINVSDFSFHHIIKESVCIFGFWCYYLKFFYICRVHKLSHCTNCVSLLLRLILSPSDDVSSTRPLHLSTTLKKSLMSGIFVIFILRLFSAPSFPKQICQTIQDSDLLFSNFLLIFILQYYIYNIKRQIFCLYIKYKNFLPATPQTQTITNTFNPYSAKFQFNLEWYAAQKYSILYIMMQITNLTKHCIISDKCETIINLD